MRRAGARCRSPPAARHPAATTSPRARAREPVAGTPAGRGGRGERPAPSSGSAGSASRSSTGTAAADPTVRRRIIHQAIELGERADAPDDVASVPRPRCRRPASTISTSTASDVPPPPPGSVYRLWLVGRRWRRLPRRLPPDARRRRRPARDVDPAGWDHVARHDRAWRARSRRRRASPPGRARPDPAQRRARSDRAQRSLRSTGLRPRRGGIAALTAVARPAGTPRTSGRSPRATSRRSRRAPRQR